MSAITRTSNDPCVLFIADECCLKIVFKTKKKERVDKTNANIDIEQVE